MTPSVSGERPGAPVSATVAQRALIERVMTKPFRFEDVQEVVASFRGAGGSE